jgi:hypothetical protein
LLIEAAIQQTMLKKGFEREHEFDLKQKPTNKTSCV